MEPGDLESEAETKGCYRRHIFLEVGDIFHVKPSIATFEEGL